MRNPLDVVISMSQFFNWSIDRTIDYMGRRNALLTLRQLSGIYWETGATTLIVGRANLPPKSLCCDMRTCLVIQKCGSVRCAAISSAIINQRAFRSGMR